jgi:hypothetical protein
MAEDKSEKVFSAPMAVIYINEVKCGFIKNLTCTENINRGEVQGIGSFYLKQAPGLSGRNTATCEFYFISLKRPEIRAIFYRDGTKEILANTLGLNEMPVNIKVYKKKYTKSTTQPMFVDTVTEDGELMWEITDFLPNSQTWNITDNQISATNVSGIYLNPVNFNETI